MAVSSKTDDKKKKILIAILILVGLPVILYKAFPKFKAWVDENILSKLKKK